MRPADSGKSHALLALAAKKTGKSEWENWLKRRAELLADPKELTAQRPILAELWPPQADIV